MILSTLLAVCTLPPQSPALAASNVVEVTYVGNCGFLLEGPEGKILIDALYEKGVGSYVRPTPDRARALRSAAAPFDEIGLVLASHHHPDHFQADVVRDHLTANESALFVSSAQAGAQLARLGVSPQRMRCATPPEGEARAVAGAPFALTSYAVHHGRERKVDNVAYSFELGGLTFLHVGDMEAVAADLEAYSFDELGVDVAFLPAWVLTYETWQRAVEEEIRPRHIVPMHMPPLTAKDAAADAAGGWHRYFAYLRQKFAGLVLLEEPMQSVQFFSGGEVGAVRLPGEVALVEAGRLSEGTALPRGWTAGAELLGDPQADSLVGGVELGAGDFAIEVRLAVEGLVGSNASVTLGDSRLSLCGAEGQLLVEGPLFDGAPLTLGSAAEAGLREGQTCRLRLARQGSELLVRLGDRVAARTPIGTAAVGRVGLLPQGARLRVTRFAVQGSPARQPGD